MNSKRPLIFAHRGDSAHAPENTLQAFEQAIQKGCDGIELDVWCCATGEPVVIHDRNPLRMTGQTGDIEKLSLSQIKALKILPDHSIPTLAEALDLIGQRVLVNIELKGGPWGSMRLEKETLRLLKEKDLLHRSILSSFNPLTLFRLSFRKPKVAKGLIFKDKSFYPLKKAWAAPFLRPDTLHPSLPLLKAKLLQKAAHRRQKVIAWTVNKIHDLEECRDLGVYAVITDDPGLLIER